MSNAQVVYCLIIFANILEGNYPRKRQGFSDDNVMLISIERPPWTVSTASMIIRSSTSCASNCLVGGNISRGCEVQLLQPSTKLVEQVKCADDTARLLDLII